MIEAPSEVQTLELDDIQGVVLRDARLPFGTYLFARIDNAAHGREFLRRIAPEMTTAASWWDPAPATVNVGISYQGLLALGLPRSSLDSFSAEFRQGMAGRADLLGDSGFSSPANWSGGLGTPDVHLMLFLTGRDETTLNDLLESAREAHADLTGVAETYRQDVHVPPDFREHFGFRDAIGNVVVEGAGDAPARPGSGPPIAAGEFLFGYRDQTRRFPPMPTPEALGRNGTYAAFRKLHQDVAAFRGFIEANGQNPEERELVAAKMVGRWRSGAPLARSPEQDDPDLGADPERNNDFSYGEDPNGLRTPRGSHIRRINPRDSLENTIADVKIHRVIRRGMAYGPKLPEGVADDGVDRGAAFLMIGASITRQFEFLQRIWINDGDFVGLGKEKDPLVGANDGTGTFTIPKKPIRRRLKGLPRFVTTRGGEYFFIPGIRALRWIAAGGAE